MVNRKNIRCLKLVILFILDHSWFRIWQLISFLSRQNFAVLLDWLFWVDFYSFHKFFSKFESVKLFFNWKVKYYFFRSVKISLKLGKKFYRTCKSKNQENFATFFSCIYLWNLNWGLNKLILIIIRSNFFSSNRIWCWFFSLTTRLAALANFVKSGNTVKMR